MTESRRRDPRVAALIAFLASALVLGAVLAFFGVGAELSQVRTVVIEVRITDIPHEVSAQIVSNETVYADPGGMPVGTITDVQVGPLVRDTPDAQGNLVAALDPTADQAVITVEARGREGDGVVAIDNQVVQGGQTFNIVTKKLFLRGTVLSVEVR